MPERQDDPPSDPSSEPTRVGGTTPFAPPQVGETVGDFLIVDRLGEGAFATVYLAHQKSMRRTVALKVSAARGLEGATLARLDHPNIVRVHDQRHLPTRNLQLLTMEYVPGGTLQAVVERVRATPEAKRSGRLFLEVIDEALRDRGERIPTDSVLRRRLEEATWPEAVALLGSQLARALDYAHTHDVLHHDVKPGNVLLGDNGRALLADFNVSSVAALEEEDEDAAGTSFGGSLPYMPPEQLEALSESHEREASSLDGRSDLFALAVVLVELLSGRRPLAERPERDGDGDEIERLAAARRHPVPLDGLLPATAPSDLQAALGQCLAPEAASRPESGARLARRLDLVQDRDAQRLLAPPARGWQRFARRLPLLSVLASGLAANVVLSVLNIAWNLQIVVGGRWQEFQQQVSWVNAVLYAIGVALGVVWVVPVTRAVRRSKTLHAPDAEGRRRARGRAIRLGDRLALLIFALWVSSGIVFAVWRHAEAGEGSSTAYFHFLLSTLLFGLLSATLCFFVVSRLTTGAFLPALLVPGDEDESAVQGLGRLARRAAFHFAACTVVPFVSIVVLALQPGNHRAAFLALGVMGALAFVLTLALGAAIRRDIATLVRILGPSSREGAR